MRRLAYILTVALLGAGCVEENPGFSPDPLLPDQCRRGQEVSETFERFERPDELDILVVVDNSGDVTRTQEGLADAFGGFLQTLESRGLSVRVGVVTTDASAAAGLAPPGTLREGCEQNSGSFADSDRPSSWKKVAACNIVQGDGGQPRQQALSVIEQSLVDQPGGLADFFRDRARRLVLVASNEDDCSGDVDLDGDDPARNECAWSSGRLSDVDATVERIRQSVDTPQGLALAVLSGPPSERDLAGEEPLRPVCQGTLGAAYPANRLYRAASAFGAQGAFQSLCTDDITFALAQLTERVVGPSVTTFCPAERMVHEPLEVQVQRGSDDTSLPLGEDGFLFLGRSAGCEQGALDVAAGPLAAADSVEVRYCVDQ